MKTGLKKLFAGFLICLTLTGCAQKEVPNDTLYQVSVLDALMQGVYDGEIALEELIKHGDFGIGTFDSLDGEMVVLDGTVYQVLSTGEVVKPEQSLTTPFAMVTDFEDETKSDMNNVTDYDALKTAVDALLPSKNEIYAIKIHGTFSHIKVRSVPSQTEPYPPLAEVAAMQPEFEYENIQGTLIGYWCPEYMESINLPGYHLHFLSDDFTAGGHLLEVTIENAVASVDTVKELQLTIPSNDNFLKTDFNGVSDEDKQGAEQ